MSSISTVMFVLLLLLAAGLVLLSSASPQEVSEKWQDLVDAINAGNQAEAEAIAEWLEAHGKSVEIEAVDEAMGRFVCAWCQKDLGPAGTTENSHGMCDECRKTLLGTGE